MVSEAHRASIPSRERIGVLGHVESAEAPYPYARESHLLSGVALPVTFTAAPSTRDTLILQTLYAPKTSKNHWVRQQPIVFGRVKLTDAADPAYFGIQGCDDKVRYHGSRNSISCRLIFSGREIGNRKVLITDWTKRRNPITKKKLAFEVAEFVRAHVEQIRHETGYHDIAFENIVLTRLLHVSKASWQPELWYEAPVRAIFQDPSPPIMPFGTPAFETLMFGDFVMPQATLSLEEPAVVLMVNGWGGSARV